MKKGHNQRVKINEVAPRDGFQMEERFIDTDDKIAFIDALSQLGYAKIEVTSFTSAQAIPSLRDAEAVMQRIERRPNVIYTTLVPNVRGGERALECGTDEFNLVMSASETHNLANLRMTRDHSLKQLCEVMAFAGAAGVPSNVSLSCAFGCPMEGEVSVDTLMRLIDTMAKAGASGVTLCDTTGMAYPTQVQDLCSAALSQFPDLNFTAHFHNTRAMGLVNTVAALEAGITQLDMSIGGIGGCPYAPGASGNVATEDVVHMLECMGYQTGIDLPGLLNAAARLKELVQHDLPAQVSRAGHRLTRHTPPADFDSVQARAQARAAAAGAGPAAS